jgi:hypothetical protein
MLYKSLYPFGSGVPVRITLDFALPENLKIFFVLNAFGFFILCASSNTSIVLKLFKNT